MKKVFLIIAAVAVVLGMMIFGGALIAAGYDTGKLSVEKQVENAYTVDGKFRDISISTSDANVTLKPSEDGKVRVELKEREHYTHSVEVVDGALRIRAVDERPWYEYFSLFSKRMSITVYVPEAKYGELKVTTSTGNIDISGEYQFAGITAKASTGNMNFSGMTCLGKFCTSVSTGNVTIKNVWAGTIISRGSTGGFRIEDITVSEEIDVQRSTGDIRFDKVFTEYIKIRTSTGNINFADTEANHKIDIKASTGNVKLNRCDADEILIRTSTGNISGTLYTEKIFHTKTSTGRIHVPQTASGGICDVSTSTGNISFSIIEN